MKLSHFVYWASPVEATTFSENFGAFLHTAFISNFLLSTLGFISQKTCGSMGMAKFPSISLQFT